MICIHQIFGLLGDTEMPELFVNCQKKVIEWCDKNDYSYRFWDAKCCERLIKKYPEFKDMYDNARHKIMKVDIIRFIILHYYGGMYLDLDVEPNDIRLKNYDFACASCIINKNTKKGDKIKNKPYEIEILQSCPCNPILTEFLRYAKTQIEEKNKMEIYNDWKVRYVLHTTGPLSFCRFMKDKKVDTYKRRGGNSTDINDGADFISHHSASYMSNGKMIE